MQKIWCRSRALVHGESGLFFGSDTVRLVFPATEVIRVYNPASGLDYQAGKDYRHEPGSACLQRLPDSRIPFLKAEERFPAAEQCVFFPAQGHNAISGGPDGKALIFDNRDFFARQQIAIDYQAASMDFPESCRSRPGRLPGWRQKLSGGRRPLRLTFLGDSITYGLNAGKVTGTPPWQPCYAELVQQELQRLYGGEFLLCNRGVDGSGCQAALTAAESWLEDAADLLVIAYGMNDLTRLTPQQYAGTISQIIGLAGKHHSGGEFLLVSPMSGNPLWKFTPPETTAAFAESLRALAEATPGVALADVQQVWSELLRRKDFYDLTGNGVNHPNDYGHRVYASVLLGVLNDREEFY